MEDRDVEQVTDLFKRYMDRFGMSPLMTAEEVKHNFLSGKGNGKVGPSGKREGQVLWVYVVEVIPMSILG
jgi:glycylpeptide N-tetradecanoyltransferase